MLFKTTDKATGKVSYHKVTVTALYGNVPLYASGININRLDREAAASMYNFTVMEITKAYQNWIRIFRYPDSTLTFEQYLNKLKQTGISPTQVGNKKNQFNLARLDDAGCYTDANCRFITRQMNLIEQHHGLHKVLNALQD